MIDAGKWGDLRVRTVSGIILLLVCVGAIWLGGVWLQCLAAAIAGTAIWELSCLPLQGQPSPQRPGSALLLGAFAAALVGVTLHEHGPYWLVSAAIPSVLGQAGRKNGNLIFAVYSFTLMLAVIAFVEFREGYGLPFTLWLVLIVIASDLMGYFAGRIVGGPKFWPRFSPKKTWSGTVAGWLGAGLVGWVFGYVYDQPYWLVPLSMLTAFAAQIGDIAESAIKRGAGVKDSSNLIPGHGGILDRFDALIGAVIFVLLWGLLHLPIPAFEV